MVTATEPRRSPDFRPTRRTLLASAALVAPATLLPAIAAASRPRQDPDPHLAVVRRVAGLPRLLQRPAAPTTCGRAARVAPRPPSSRS